MRGRRRTRTAAPPPRDLELERELAEDDEDSAQELEQVGALQSLLSDRRKLVSLGLLFVLLVGAVYVLAPKLLGLDEALSRFDDATWYWVVIAIVLNFGAFGAYVALFRGVLGGTRDDSVQRRLDVRASYEITMAGLAATRIFSAAGAGGIALTYWALRKAGMPRRRSACRMVAFLVLMYSVYLIALVVFGVLLRVGVLRGEAPVGGTIVPAGVAGATGFAFGFGTDRMPLMRHGIDDLREMFTNDVRFLDQF
jgi:hypothetical protein